MKKIIISSLVFVFGVTQIHAASCTDLSKSIFRNQESSSVLALQNFLFEKGYLKATPNGYFGNGTFAAVKLYQKGLGFEQVGIVGPATRAAIKKATCSITQGSAGSTSSSLVTSSSPSSSVSTAPSNFPATPSGLRNAKRKEGAEIILKAFYRYFTDSRGVHAVPVSSTPVELCIISAKLGVATVASSSAGSATVVTPVSPCANFIDVTYLVPTYLQSMPKDPSLATTSVLTGYMITRSEVNDITISAKSPEDGAIIKMTCNFNGFCKEIKYISTVIYDRPDIASINRNIFLRDASPRTPLIIKGKNFTKKNTIKLFSLYNSKEYTLGDFVATTYSTSTMSLVMEGAVFAQSFPCGNGCAQKLPLGDYMLSITNEGGVSNTTRIALRGFTTSSLSVQVNGSVIPTTKNVKVGTITLSSSIPISLTSLTLTSSSTSKNLASKISNFVLKDASDGTTYAGGAGGTFTLSGLKMFENESRVFDVYIDTAEALNSDAGFITYGGKFLVSDTFAYVDMELPIKEFSFTVSH